LENERSALAVVTGMVRNNIKAVQTSGKLDERKCPVARTAPMWLQSFDSL
jgi:hypothetical protein